MYIKKEQRQHTPEFISSTLAKVSARTVIVPRVWSEGEIQSDYFLAAQPVAGKIKLSFRIDTFNLPVRYCLIMWLSGTVFCTYFNK